MTFAFTNKILSGTSLHFSSMRPDLLSDRICTWPIIISHSFDTNITATCTGTAWPETPDPWIFRQVVYSSITCVRLVPLKPDILANTLLEHLEPIVAQILLIRIKPMVLNSIELVHEGCLHGAYVRAVPLVCPSRGYQVPNLMVLMMNYNTVQSRGPKLIIPNKIKYNIGRL